MPPAVSCKPACPASKLPAPPAPQSPAVQIPAVQIYDGTIDGSLDAAARGASPGSLLDTATGTFDAAMSGGTVTAIDLPALTAGLKARGKRLKPVLLAAIGAGQSTGLAGTLAGRIENGSLTLSPSHLDGVFRNHKCGGRPRPS